MNRSCVVVLRPIESCSVFKVLCKLCLSRCCMHDSMSMFGCAERGFGSFRVSSHSACLLRWVELLESYNELVIVAKIIRRKASSDLFAERGSSLLLLEREREREVSIGSRWMYLPILFGLLLPIFLQMIDTLVCILDCWIC